MKRVYIKGMHKLPKTCSECSFSDVWYDERVDRDEVEVYCDAMPDSVPVFQDQWDYKFIRPNNCPLRLESDRYKLKLPREKDENGKEAQARCYPSDNLCVVCGGSIPEGTIVCKHCLEGN